MFFIMKWYNGYELIDTVEQDRLRRIMRRRSQEMTEEDLNYVGRHAVVANEQPTGSMKRKVGIWITAIFLASTVTPILGGTSKVNAESVTMSGRSSVEVSRSETRSPIEDTRPSQGVKNSGTWNMDDSEENIGNNIIELARSQQAISVALNALKSTINGYDDLDNSKWTSDSWTAFDSKRNEARELTSRMNVTNDIKTNNDGVNTLNAMATELTNLRNALKEKPKALAGPSNSGGPAAPTAPASEIQAWAHDEVLRRGWSEADFTDLVWLWNRESGWRMNAANPSGAYGIPQCLGHAECQTDDYRNNWKTQVNWGLNYISARYGSPSAAASHSRSSGWY